MVTENLAYKIPPSNEAEIRVPESPIKWCSVSLSEIINKGGRLEASVFDVEAKQAWETIENGKYATINICGGNGIAIAYTCNRFKRIWKEKSNYPIYQPSSITDVKPQPDGYLSKNTRTNIDELRVNKGQVLLTCSGTIGKVSYVSDTLDKAILSHDLLRITCRNQYDAGYLYTYFKTEIGNKILLSNRYGAVITHIEAEHLNDVIVPNPPTLLKKRIHNLIVKSYYLRDESNLLMDEAERLMIKELQLPPIHHFRQYKLPVNAFSIKLSNFVKRLDTSYHIPEVYAIISHLKIHSSEVTNIGDNHISKNVILPNRYKRIYVEKDYGRTFIGGKQIGELDPSSKKYLSNIHHGNRIAQQLELHENMILITRSGTIGKVALVGKHWNGWAASEHIIRVVPANKNIAGYLYIFLASDYGQALIKRYTYGSVVDEIDDNHVRQIPFPILKNHTEQKKINDLVLEANKKRYEAYKLEQDAISIMNKEITFAD